MNTRDAKHFIIAAYYFPPLGLAGTARPLAMANFLAEQGFAVSVLTVKPIAYPEYDQSQLDSLHPGVKVYRAGSADPARIAKVIPIAKTLLRLRKRSNRPAVKMIFPDTKVGFVRPASQMLKQLIRSDMQNILITTSPPVSIHQLGLDVAGQGSARWVADFRDIWGSLSLEDQSDSFREKAASYLTEITDTATLVTTTSPHSVDYLQTEINAAADYHFLPNGYHETDFSDPIREPNQYFGLYGTLNHLIGVEKLLGWIREWQSKSPDRKLSLRHVGYLDLPDLDDQLSRHNLQDCFQSTGYLSHCNSIQAIRSHSANIIMLSDQFDTSYIIPSKLFELLRAEPPLIAILPPGNAARLLLEEHNFPNVYVVDSAAEFAEVLTRIYARTVVSPRTGVERFERRHELSGFLHRLEELL